VSCKTLLSCLDPANEGLVVSREVNRKVLAAKANEVGLLSRVEGAPLLRADSARENLLAWLQWCDPNGCYTDELAAAEDFDPITLAEAWDHLASTLEGA
jgi:hypothetical protein